MNSQQAISPQQALAHAQKASRIGDKRLARHWSAYAASLAPQFEEPWIFLGALANPRASIDYFKRALEINPNSARAQRGLQLAIQRVKNPAQKNGKHPATAQQKAPTKGKRLGCLLIPLMAAIMVVSLGLVAWIGYPYVNSVVNENQFSQPSSAFRLLRLTETPTPTNTSTPTSTPTNTPTPTDTPTPTSTYTPTPRPTRTSIPPTSIPPTPVPPAKSNLGLPPGVGKNERWIDIDLSAQRLTAYKGTKVVDSFLVSTGLWNTPTVTGQFSIYIKLNSQTMSGPGYYLPDVPYVMYFYEDYSTHGTYWHNNFGTPMSHGCVNMRTRDAKWLYNFASIGTIVVIHY